MQELAVSSGHGGGQPQLELVYTCLNMCESVCWRLRGIHECVRVNLLQCNAMESVRVCVCVKVLASSTALVMLRQTVSGCVYFWVSDSVSMAADASERKALRYKQTLVSVASVCPPLLLPLLLFCRAISLPCHVHVSPLCALHVILHDAPVLAAEAPQCLPLTYCSVCVRACQ